MFPSDTITTITITIVTATLSCPSFLFIRNYSVRLDFISWDGERTAVCLVSSREACLDWRPFSWVFVTSPFQPTNLTSSDVWESYKQRWRSYSSNSKKIMIKRERMEVQKKKRKKEKGKRRGCWHCPLRVSRTRINLSGQHTGIWLREHVHNGILQIMEIPRNDGTLQRDTNDVHSLLLQYCLPTPLLYYQASLSLSLSSLYPFQRRFVRSLSLFPAVHYLEHLRRAPYHVSFGWTIDEQSATRSSSVSRPLTITLRDGSWKSLIFIASPNDFRRAANTDFRFSFETSKSFIMYLY